MPSIQINHVNIHYEEIGTGPETVVFAHGLLWSGRVFDRQVAFFKDRYRCITYDFRGQGQSQVTEAGYDMDTLMEDTATLIRELSCAPCHFVGLSMGSFIGMRLACCHPELIQSLVLIETTADPESKANIAKYRLLAFIARCFGTKMVAGQVMSTLFGEKFLKDPARAIQRQEMKNALAHNHRIGAPRAVNGVTARTGFFADLPKIQVPTLILVGNQDRATPIAQAERVHSQIVGSHLVVIPDAGHVSPVEEPTIVNQSITEFFNYLEFRGISSLQEAGLLFREHNNL